MKYIIVESTLCGEYPVLFPEHINHCDMARRFDGKVVSAGKVLFNGSERDIQVFGNSVSLKLQSRNEDIFLIRQTLI